MMKVKIITLFQDNLPLLRQYMRSLYTKTHYPFELILVDNGSNIETKKELLKLAPSPNVKIISLNFPVNFSAGNNLAMNLFNELDTIFVLCNNDVLFEEKWLNKIVTYYEENKEHLNHLVAPVIKTNGLLYKGGLVTIQNGKLDARWVNLKEDIKPNYLQGCCLALTDAIFDMTGGLDPTFKYYFEDVDLCYRYVKMGGKLVTLKNITIEHLHAKSSDPKRKQKLMEESKKLFMAKWKNRLEE